MKVMRTSDYYHVRLHDRSKFVEIKTPTWASHAAESIARGALVRMGRKPWQFHGSKAWAIQAILIPVRSVKTEREAERMASKIQDLLERKKKSSKKKSAKKRSRRKTR